MMIITTNNSRYLFTLIFIFIIFTEIFASSQNAHSVLEWRCFMKHISIHGETSINNFNFYYFVPFEDSIPPDFGTPICKSDTDIVTYKIPVLAFEGNKPLMIEDFRQLLKASQYPDINVTINKNIFREIVKGNSPILNLELTLAGVTNLIISNYVIASCDDKSIHIKGDFSIRITDYDITPPKKFFGLIQVGDTLIINFDILLIKNLKS